MSVTTPSMTFRYGVSMKPNRLMRAKRREVADEADVRAFRRLDRAHPAVVARVHVSHLEAGALTAQTTRAEGRETPLVGEPGERVRLVHELAELAGAEELLDRRDDRPDVDQGLRRDRLDVLGGHALAHDPLHPAQADAHLVLDQLADRAHPAVAEVVDVVGEVVVRLVVRVQLHQVRDRGEDVGAATSCTRPGPRRGPRSGPGCRGGRACRLTLSYSSTSFFVTLCRPTLAMS